MRQRLAQPIREHKQAVWLRALNETLGQGLVEFSLCLVLFVILLFGFIEVGRMILVYTTVANGADAGVRYAIVHGSDCVSPASPSQIQTVVKNFLSAAPMNTAGTSLSISVSYPDSLCNSPGCHVKVTVSYPYDPLTIYTPLNLTLTSTSEGVITF